MRILLLADYFLPSIGGVQIRAVALLERLQAAGHTTLVVSADLSEGGPAPAASHERGVAVRRVDLIAALASGDPLRVGRGRNAARRAIEGFAPDVIHAYVSGPAVLAVLPVSRVPMVASFTIWPTHSRAGPATLLGRTLADARWVTANSRALLHRLRGLAPEIADRSSVLTSGEPPPAQSPAPLPDAPPVLLGLGRLVDDKGFDVAVRALARIGGDARLVIAGDGPARDGLVRLAAELGVAERVRMPGWVAPGEVGAAINEATVVLVPSRWQEAYASVAIQAAQLGRPVLAAHVGGMAEAVRDGETGRLFAAEDDAELARILGSLLADPPELRRLGRGGLAWARRAVSFDRYVAEIEGISGRVPGDGVDRGGRA